MATNQLNEGLQRGDLNDFVSDLFTIDQYRSKMGEDKDVVVLGFKVKEKYPAIDLMEFLEKGHKFILDADISSGEEKDGHYHVFVEIERTPDLTEQIKEILSGVGQLCNCREWRFRYQKAPHSIEFSKEAIKEHVPLTPADYERKILEYKNKDIKDFFDQGATNVTLEANNILTFSRPYSGDIQAKFIAIGEYNDIKQHLPGKLSLDESSQSQVLFLNKYLGNYEIHKIQNKFLIKNKNQAIIIEKDRW